MAPHGTVKGYKKDNEQYKPILGEIEFKESYHVISNVQGAALKYIGDCKTFQLVDEICNNSKPELSFKKFIINPEKNYADLFGEMQFYDSGIHRIANKQNIYDIKKFVQGYYKSFWKIGYLRRNLKLRLPYLQIYIISRNIGKIIKR